MRRVTFRSIWEHKRRLLSTVVAVVLGVAFMSGTFVFADTIDKVFDDLFADVNEGVDVQVQGAELFDGGFGGGPDARQLLPTELADDIEAVDGVTAAEPFVQVLGFGSNNRVLDPDGEPVGSSNGPPTLLESWIEDEQLNPYNLRSGSAPLADDEIAMNVGAAEDADLELGDQLEVVSQLGRSTYTLVGLFTFGEAESAAGAISVDFTIAETQRLAGIEGRTQTFLVAGDESVDDAALADRVRDALPDDVEVITGEEAAEQTAGAVQEGFGFFRQVLTIFGAIALLVGTFIIANTFSILVAQRTRELALMRAIGASRRQVLTSVLLEAGVIGLLAAVLGLVAGIALATAVTAGLDAAGADLPTDDLVISSNTVVIAFVVGLGVTLLASIVPAVQATRVPPLAALRDVSIDRSGASKPRIVIGALVLLGSAFLLSQAWTSGGDTDVLPSVGTGALLLIIGSIVIGPVLAGPTVRVLGRPLGRLRGITGQLATENAARSPKRTSATASALLIGVTLVGFITVFAASANASIEEEVGRGFQADLVVQSSAGGFGPPGGFPATVLDDVRAVDGVETVTGLGFARAQLVYPNGDTAVQFVTSLDPDTALIAFDPRMVDGEVDALSTEGIIVDQGIADDNDLEIGDPITLVGTGGDEVNLFIEAISDDLTLLGFWVVDLETLDQVVPERQLAQAFATVESGADIDRVIADAEEATSAVPSLEVLDREGFAGSLEEQITGFLLFIYGLLFVSILIAMIGIANTLSLSIAERTRELGLLRAVGMTRRQMRTTVRWEAVLIAVLGTIVGLGIGLLVSWALVKSLSTFGLTSFAVPWPSLVVVVLAAGVLGILASFRASRRAAKLDVLDAIASE